MADLGMSVLVTREQLALPDLEINDFVDYYVGPEFLGGQQAWNRSEAGSPFLDGQLETYATLQNVTEQFAVEVLAGDPVELAANISALVAAFSQSRYTLNIEIGAQNWQYSFTAADFATPWTGPRLLANQQLVSFSARRKPHALNPVGY